MNPKLIICVDGLGYDFVSQENTPFIYSFGKEHYLSKLETLFAFTGLEYSFFSGKSPEEHKIWFEFVKSSNSLFDDAILRGLSFNGKIRTYWGAFLQLLNKRTWVSGLFKIPKDKLKYFDTSVKEGLWKLSFFQKEKFVFYKWPFFITKNGFEKRKIIFKYEKDSERLKRLLDEKNKDIYYTQLMEFDKLLHKVGKKSKDVKKILKRIDKILEKNVKRFLSINPNGEVFLWSDHGFSDVVNYIDLENNLPKSKDYIYFIAGTSAHFWFKNEDIKQKIIKILSEFKNIKILNKETAKKYHIPFIKEYGDLFCYVEKGNYIFPNFYQRTSKEKFKSMHGYPDNDELNGFFLSNKKIPKKLKMYQVKDYLK
jgi:predicted AlkP superfamily pyrophosphatase or phosphodiesterase